jgi:hypothetical protein
MVTLEATFEQYRDFELGIDCSSLRNRMKSFILCIGISLALCSGADAHGQQMPAPAPIPVIPPTRPENSLTMQDPESFPEVKMDFTIAGGAISTDVEFDQ